MIRNKYSRINSGSWINQRKYDGRFKEQRITQLRTLTKYRKIIVRFKKTNEIFFVFGDTILLSDIKRSNHEFGRKRPISKDREMKLKCSCTCRDQQ